LTSDHLDTAFKKWDYGAEGIIMLRLHFIGVLLSLVIARLTFAGDNTSEKFTTTRGIKVVETSQGKTIDRYHGFYALVIGNGNYINGRTSGCS
jgi:hypothetical protein